MEFWQQTKTPEDYHNLVSNPEARIYLNIHQFFHGTVELTHYKRKECRFFINEKGRIAMEFHVQTRVQKNSVVSFQLPFFHIVRMRIKAPDTGPRDFEHVRHGINHPLACLELEVDDFTVISLWKLFGDKDEFDKNMNSLDLSYYPVAKTLLLFISPFESSTTEFIRYMHKDMIHGADFDELYNFFNMKISKMAEYERKMKKKPFMEDFISFVDDSTWRQHLLEYSLISYRNDISRNAPTIHFMPRDIGYRHVMRPQHSYTHGENGAVKAIRLSNGSRIATKNDDIQMQQHVNVEQVLGKPVSGPKRQRQVKKLIETMVLEDEEPVAQSSQSTSGSSEQKPPTMVSIDALGAMPLISYPKGDRAPISVANSDMRVLAHGEMLNDTIIEFYLRYIRNELILEPEKRAKICILSSFLFQRLTEKLTINQCKRNARCAAARFEVIRKGFQMVKTWTRRKNLFDMDYILIPINDEFHWYMIVVVKPRLAVAPAPTEDPVAMRMPGSTRPNPDTYIVVLDSLPDNTDLKRTACVDIVRDYLECEFLDKKPMQGVLERSRLGAIHPSHTPVQKNFIDCGLYMLLFTELFLTRTPTHEELATFNFARKYPHFDVESTFMRDKVCKRIMSLLPADKRHELEAYEQRMRKGVTILTEDARIDLARRPRRHSERIARPKTFIRRAHSEPPDLTKCSPPGAMKAPPSAHH